MVSAPGSVLETVLEWGLGWAKPSGLGSATVSGLGSVMGMVLEWDLRSAMASGLGSVMQMVHGSTAQRATHSCAIRGCCAAPM